MIELTAQRAVASAPVGVCAPPDYAMAEECDAPVATVVMLTGVWR